MISKKAFSLIEIITSTGIITLTVFGIYKLIAENNKIIANSNNYLSQKIIFENTKECLKWQNFTWKRFLDFWKDLKSCNFSNNQNNFTNIDWVDYFISIENIDPKWKISIESSTVWLFTQEILQK